MKIKSMQIFAIFASVLMLTVIAMPMVAAEANKNINNSPWTATDIEKIEELSAELKELLYEMEEINHTMSDYFSKLEKLRNELKYYPMLEMKQMSEHISLTLQQQISKVEELDIHPEIKSSLLAKLNATSNKNEQALQYIANGNEIQANITLNAAISIQYAFINYIKVLSEKIDEESYIYEDEEKSYYLISITEENACILIERSEDIIDVFKDIIDVSEDVFEEIREESEDIKKELKEIVKEFHETGSNVRQIVAELKAAGAHFEVSVDPETLKTWLIIRAGNPTPVEKIIICVLVSYAASRVAKHILRLVHPAWCLCWVCSDIRITGAGFAITVGIIMAKGISAKVELARVGLGLKSITEYIVYAGGKFALYLFVIRPVLVATVFIIPCSHRTCVLGPYSPLILRLHICDVDNAPGMHEFRWFDQDFNWTHRLPRHYNFTRLNVKYARLAITAWDVDWGPEPHWEHNIISVDNHTLGVLTGTPPRRWDNEMSVTTFSISPLRVDIAPSALRAMFADGEVNVHIDIDSTHRWRRWVVVIHRSLMRINYRWALPPT